MADRWFLKAATICSILHFIMMCGEANSELKQGTDVKYLEETNLSNSSNDEKAYKKTNDRIKEVIKQQNSRGEYKQPTNEGPRSFFYKKYMKIGKSKGDCSDSNKEGSDSLTTNNIASENLKTVSQENVQKTTIAANTKNQIVDSSKGFLQKEIEHLRMLDPAINQIPQRVHENYIHSKDGKPLKEMYLLYNSSYFTNFANVPENISVHNNINNGYYKTLIDLNNDISDILKSKDNKLYRLKKCDKQLENETSQIDGEVSISGLEGNVKNEIVNRNREEEYNQIAVSNSRNTKSTPINGEPSRDKLRVGRSLKDFIYLRKRNKYQIGNKLIHKDEKEDTIIGKPSMDQRKVRSCELKMEDLRESFLPYEQLSIYHPKMSMTDQFILSDTMF